MKTSTLGIAFRVWNYDTYSVVETVNSFTGRVLAEKTHPDVPDLSLAEIYEDPHMWAVIRKEWKTKEV